MSAFVRSFFARLKFFLTQTLAKRLLTLMFFTWAVTLTGFCFGLHSSDGKIAGVFLNWTSDVIFFSVVGITVALISSIPPARESFEERAAILFQGLKGSQVDYARSLLDRLGNYSEESRTTITIDQDQDGWFRILAKTTHKVRNLIEDLRTTYILPIIDEDQRGNPTGRIGEVLSFEVDGERQLKQAATPGHEADYAVEIGGEAVRNVQLLLSRWIGAGHHTAYTPIRFTKRFTLALANELNHSVLIKFEVPKRPLITLKARSQREELLLVDVSPVGPIYEFYLFRTRDDYKEWQEARDRGD